MNKSSLKCIEKENVSFFRSKSVTKLNKTFGPDNIKIKRTLFENDKKDQVNKVKIKKKNTIISFQTMSIKVKNPRIMRMNSMSVKL